jgi:hypothetical protein
VRKTTAQYLSMVVEKMGPNKCLLGPRDVAEHLLPSAAKFVQDSSPYTRYYGRVIFSCLYQHPQFEKLMRKFLNPANYRTVSGILETIKRRVSSPSHLVVVTDSFLNQGVGEKPPETIKP